MIYQAPEMQPEKPKPVKEKPIKKVRRKKNEIKHSNTLFDRIKEKYKLKSDAELGRLIDITSPELSRVRGGVSRLSAAMILSIYDTTDMTIEEIRDLI